MEKVSVIMPVYNAGKFLKHSIHSVQLQTYDNWELLIVNDASTDESLAEAKSFAEKDSRIKVFDMHENLGVGACRNFAIARASGRYLAFLDADDLWSKRKLEKHVSFMQENDYALSHTSFAYIDEKGKFLPTGQVIVDRDVNMALYMKTTQIGMSSVMIDHQKIKEVRFPEDRKLCEDATTWMRYLRKGLLFHGLNDVLLLYRIRNKQLSGNKPKMALNTFKRYMKEKKIALYKRFYYFMHYAYNGLEKRLKAQDIDKAQIFKDFNCNQRP